LPRFKGIYVKLYDSYNCSSLPDFLKGRDPELFSLDRWHPIDDSGKDISKTFYERNYGWVPTIQSDIVYGLERWGELVPDEYREWFAIIVIRPRLTLPEQAIKIASLSNFRGSPEE